MGLDLKSHEVGARDYLFALITLLEEVSNALRIDFANQNI